MSEPWLEIGYTMNDFNIEMAEAKVSSAKERIDNIIAYHKEQHQLIMRILNIIEYSNLQDLKTLSSVLIENGFVTENEQKETDERPNKWHSHPK